MDRKDKRGILLALSGFSMFSIGDLLIKFLAEDGFAPQEIAFYLQLFFLPMLLLLSPWLGGINAALRTKNLGLHLARSLCGVLIFFMMITGFDRLGLAMSYTLIFAGPFFATVLSALFLKDKVGRYRWITLATGFIGILVVLRPSTDNLDPTALGILLAAFLFAVTTILARRIGEHEPLLAFSLFGSVVSMTVFAGLTFWDGEANIPVGRQWGLLALIGAFHVTGSLMTARAFSMTETALVAPFHYVQLLWGTLFGVLIFSTVPDVWTALGASIIVMSGLFLIYREYVRHRMLTAGVTSHGGFGQD
ncbi:DMT family transporter [Marinihelvus fidelis]|uniref:DMT family transporter n=1 Tax=Marinihelvus fidelis TaxID=2613842 RepID=A0A5N0THU1_9GAMM|nr:DMT family transporter [Marinihelvus fidelis]KAA9134171.1 DMT family transporter [Marinihelvus fidelis]